MNFDRVADIYDTTRPIPPDALEQIAATVEAATNATADTKFLEIGIGTGRIGLPIARRGHDYTGIDISEGMMGVLRARAAAENVPITLIKGDITALPFPDATFDVVVAVHVLHLFPEWRAALDEVWRVLKPNGYFVLGSESESGSDIHNEMRRRWAGFVRDNGFDLRPRYGTWARLEETLTELGCFLATHRAAHWSEELVPLKLMEQQRARTFSQSWDVPEDVLQRTYEQMVAWGRERFGDLEQPQAASEDFLVMVAPKPPAA